MCCEKPPTTKPPTTTATTTQTTTTRTTMKKTTTKKVTMSKKQQNVPGKDMYKVVTKKTETGEKPTQRSTTKMEKIEPMTTQRLSTTTTESNKVKELPKVKVNESTNVLASERRYEREGGGNKGR